MVKLFGFRLNVNRSIVMLLSVTATMVISSTFVVKSIHLNSMHITAENAGLTVPYSQKGAGQSIAQAGEAAAAAGQSTPAARQASAEISNKSNGTQSQPAATTKASQPGTTHTATSTTPPSTPTPPPPSPVINLALGQMTFDDMTKPTITFTLPVTASASGSVTMSVVEDDNDATLCSHTLSFSAAETINMTCGYNPTQAPHMVYGYATAGTVSVKTQTGDYIGGLNW